MRSATAVYTVLAFAITWIGVSPLVGEALGLHEGPVPDWLHGVGALGPVTAAFLTAAILGGRDGVAGFLASLSRWRLPAGWWLVAVGSPLLLLGIAVLAARVVTGHWAVGPLWAGTRPEAGWWVAVAAVSVAYGLGEEPGWRGFLLPELLRRHSPWRATLITAVVWASWHAPFFTYRYEFTGPATIVGFLTAMAAGAFWLTFLYLSTRGSVPAVALWHVVWNVVNLAAAEMSDLVVGILNGGMIALGFGLLLVVGPGLRWRAPT